MFWRISVAFVMRFVYCAIVIRTEVIIIHTVMMRRPEGGGCKGSPFWVQTRTRVRGTRDGVEK